MNLLNFNFKKCKMIFRFLFLFLILFNTLYAKSQHLFNKLEKGRKFKVQIVKNGDAWTDPDDIYKIKIFKIGSSYLLELYNDKIKSQHILSKKDVLEITQYFEKWKTDRCFNGKCGLSYNVVFIKIGFSTYRYFTSDSYGDEIFNKYCTTKPFEQIKF